MMKNSIIQLAKEIIICENRRKNSHFVRDSFFCSFLCQQVRDGEKKIMMEYLAVIFNKNNIKAPMEAKKTLCQHFVRNINFNFNLINYEFVSVREKCCREQKAFSPIAVHIFRSLYCAPPIDVIGLSADSHRIYLFT